MKMLLKLFAGLWMTSLIIMTVIYLFSDTAEDTVTEASFEDLILAHKKLAMKQSGLYDPNYKDWVKKVTGALASADVDVSAPIYRLLKKNDAITDLSVKSSVKVKSNDREVWRTVISFKHDGLNYAVSLLAIDKAFLPPQEAEFLGNEMTTVSGPGSNRPLILEDPTVLLAALTPDSKIKLAEALPPELIRQQTSVQKALPPARPKLTADELASAKTLVANIRDAQIRQEVTSILPLRRSPDPGLGGIFQTQRGQAWLVLNTVTGPNAYTCDIDGPAVISGNQLTVQHDDCQLTATMDANGMARVVTNSCDSMCGLGGTLNGLYTIGEKAAMP